MKGQLIRLNQMDNKKGKQISGLEVIKKKIENEMKRMQGLSDHEKKYKNEDIKEMINYYNNLTEKIEDRRNRIENFSLQLLAISAAGLPLIVSQKDSLVKTQVGQIIFWMFSSITSVLVISSLVTTLVFQFQSWYRYPFLKLDRLGNQWKWFYYGNPEVLKINTNPFNRNPENMHNTYMKGLLYYTSKYIDENIDYEITDNIQQLYLLQVHNYYKNRFYLQLIKIWKWAFGVIMLLLIVLSIFYLMNSILPFVGKIVYAIHKLIS